MNLKNVLAPVVPSREYKYALIAAGPLSHQPNTVPLRIVLVDTGNEFAVYEECFRVPGEPDGDLKKQCLDENTTSNFYHGDYFPHNEIDNATRCFAARVTKGAAHLPSIYREETA